MKRVSFIFLTICLFFMGTIPSSHAQVEKVTLRVDGLACPFCAYGLEKKIKQLEGYKNLEVLINEGKVIIEWREGKPLNLENIHQAVDKAGFTLRGVSGQFAGRISIKEGNYSLVLSEPLKQSFYLYEQAAIEKIKGIDSENHGRSARVLTEEHRKRLDHAIEKNERVRIIGPVHQHKDRDLLTAIGIKGLESVRSDYKK